MTSEWLISRPSLSSLAYIYIYFSFRWESLTQVLIHICGENESSRIEDGSEAEDEDRVHLGTCISVGADGREAAQGRNERRPLQLLAWVPRIPSGDSRQSQSRHGFHRYSLRRHARHQGPIPSDPIFSDTPATSLSPVSYYYYRFFVLYFSFVCFCILFCLLACSILGPIELIVGFRAHT